MMFTWDNFDWFALVSIVLWAAGAGVALFSKKRRRWAILLTGVGTLVFATFMRGSGSTCSVRRCAPWERPGCGTPSS